jgi:hypothetical protein
MSARDRFSGIVVQKNAPANQLAAQEIILFGAIVKRGMAAELSHPA